MKRAFRPTRNCPRQSRGVTLLELIIVMTIMLMITAAAIPVMLPALQNRRMRESSRLVSSYFSAARSKAIETGRSVGVMVERANGQPFATTLSMVEVPPPYSGDNFNSRALVSASGALSFFGKLPGLQDSLWTGLLRSGDRVRLDYKGPLFSIIASGVAIGAPITAPPSVGQPWTLIPPAGGTAVLPSTYGTLGVAFQIFRQPVRSSAAPLQLPEGTCIDLSCSGMGLSNVTPFNTSPVPPPSTVPLPFDSPTVLFNSVVLFAPNGAVDFVSAPTLQRPTGPIFLLLGRRELMPDITTSKQTNLPENKNLHDSDPTPANAYLSNYWISIGHQTGLVTVSENAFNSIDPTSAGAAALIPATARTFAVSAQGIGGQ